MRGAQPPLSMLGHAIQTLVVDVEPMGQAMSVGIAHRRRPPLSPSAPTIPDIPLSRSLPATDTVLKECRQKQLAQPHTHLPPTCLISLVDINPTRTVRHPA